jgi:hypothetical protein
MKDRRPKNKTTIQEPDGAKVLQAVAAMLEINIPLKENKVYLLGKPYMTDPNE